MAQLAGVVKRKGQTASICELKNEVNRRGIAGPDGIKAGCLRKFSQVKLRIAVLRQFCMAGGKGIGRKAQPPAGGLELEGVVDRAGVILHGDRSGIVRQGDNRLRRCKIRSGYRLPEGAGSGVFIQRQPVDGDGARLSGKRRELRAGLCIVIVEAAGTTDRVKGRIRCWQDKCREGIGSVAAGLEKHRKGQPAFCDRVNGNSIGGALGGGKVDELIPGGKRKQGGI